MKEFLSAPKYYTQVTGLCSLCGDYHHRGNISLHQVFNCPFTYIIVISLVEEDGCLSSCPPAKHLDMCCIARTHATTTQQLCFCAVGNLDTPLTTLIEGSRLEGGESILHPLQSEREGERAVTSVWPLTLCLSSDTPCT